MSKDDFHSWINDPLEKLYVFELTDRELNIIVNILNDYPIDKAVTEDYKKCFTGVLERFQLLQTIIEKQNG